MNRVLRQESFEVESDTKNVGTLLKERRVVQVSKVGSIRRHGKAGPDS